MKYRTKLFLTFSILVFISTFIALFIIYGESSRLVINQIRGQLLSISVTAASSIDGDLVQKIDNQKQTKTQAYNQLIDQLRQIRDSNRRPDIYIHYLYIIRPERKLDGFVFVADAEENPMKISKFGDLFPTNEELFQNINKPFVEKNMSYDHWGQWITAYSPIYNSDGKVVATLGADISMKDIKQKMRKLLLYGIIAMIGALIVSIVIAHLLAKLVTNSLNYLCETVNAIGEGNLKARAQLDTNDEFDELSIAINSMARGLEERERLKLGFARYVSQYVLDKIIKSDTPTKLEGERRKVTIFFSDIRNFTQISEALPPEKVVGLLNEYFGRMIEIIFAHGGTLDKFIGDGLMVEFGAPLEDPEQEKHAVEAAIHMQHELASLSKKWQEDGYPDVIVGMGIHTGFAVVGNIGSNVRMEYTAIGDAVNVASRLETATKKLDRSIIISEETHKSLAGDSDFSFEDLGDIELPGRKQKMKAFAVNKDFTKPYDGPEGKHALTKDVDSEKQS